MKGIIQILLLLLLSLTASLKAQWVEDFPTYEDTLQVYEDLFGLEEPLNLTMKFNIRDFQRTRSQEKYHPAEMTCHVRDSFIVNNPVRVKARGIFRRDNCVMPPFWLNIRYAGIDAEKLQGIRRMKVVTRCRVGNQYADYVLREYLVYKIYNLLTPYSFNVRLIDLKYVDTGRKNKESQCWAFLIEPDDHMADRLKAKVIKSDVLSMRTVSRSVMDNLAMFQYMIGNGDYSVTGRHNLKILAMEESGPYGFVPVPYDFDYTGLVNAHYAIPGESLGIKSVRERYFLGPCRIKNLHIKAIGELESIRGEIEEMIRAFDYLDEEARLDMIEYLESFFNAAEKEKFIEREITTTCR
ncbi:MAG: hypothetical protein GY790_23445 [Bacteroidetes bacterium]|nr:hypothetical protein [Bacteroidota bacterium]